MQDFLQYHKYVQIVAMWCWFPNRFFFLVLFYVTSFIDGNSYKNVLSSSELEKHFLALERFKIFVSVFLLIYIQKLNIENSLLILWYPFSNPSEMWFFLYLPFTDAVNWFISLILLFSPLTSSHSMRKHVFIFNPAYVK